MRVVPARPCRFCSSCPPLIVQLRVFARLDQYGAAPRADYRQKVTLGTDQEFGPWYPVL